MRISIAFSGVMKSRWTSLGLPNPAAREEGRREKNLGVHARLRPAQVLGDGQDGNRMAEERLVNLLSWLVCSCSMQVRLESASTCTCQCSGLAPARVSSQVPLHMFPPTASPARGPPERTTIRSLLGLAAKKENYNSPRVIR